MHRDPPRDRPALPTSLVAALGALLAKVTVGDPANKESRMGPLASLDQREEVRQRVRELARKLRLSSATLTG